VGRHSAVDGSAVDPVVADALARRSEGAAPGRHGDLRADTTQSDLGWPGTSTTHEGLGWPGGMSAPGSQADVPPGVPQTPARPRGWRRFFSAA
jgi:hypothetical protein